MNWQQIGKELAEAIQGIDDEETRISHKLI